MCNSVPSTKYGQIVNSVSLLQTMPLKVGLITHAINGYTVAHDTMATVLDIVVHNCVG